MCNCFLKEDEEYLCFDCQSYIKNERFIKKIENCYYSYPYNKKMKKFIENYKLKNQRKLGSLLSFWLKKEIERLIEKEEIDYVIPVPISERRLRERGFNQVIEVLEKADIKYIEIKRIKDTKQMYKLGARKRRDNIREAFNVGDQKFYKKNLLIVDDILTTGATVEEIIGELNFKYEPQKIIVYTFSLAAKNIERNKNVVRSLCR